MRISGLCVLLAVVSLGLGCGDEATTAPTPSGSEDAGTSLGTEDAGTGDAGTGAGEPDVSGGETGCAGLSDGAACDDGDACTQDTTCKGGVCGGGTSVVCGDTSACQTAICDAALGCVETVVSNGTACTLNCFTAATCQEGQCVGSEPILCPAPTDPCIDSLACSSATGQCTKPVYRPVGSACEKDSDICTAEACTASGACESTGEVETCATQQQNNPCWTWQCSKKAGCQQIAFVGGVSCDDGNPCTYSDTCTEQSGQKLCLGTPLTGDDNNPCTEDKCVDGSIEHNPLTGPACDAAPCEFAQCAAGQCVVSGDQPDGTACGAGQVCASGICGGSGLPAVGCPTLADGPVAPDTMHYSPVALTAGGAIHVMGGSPGKQHLIYTPGAGWTTAPELQKATSEGAGAQIGQKLYVVDGDQNEGVRILDLDTGTWSLGAVRPGTAMRGPAAGSNGSALFVAGGADGNLVGTDATYRYDPGPDTWTAIEAMPTARGFIAHASIGGRLYAFGGRNKALAGGTIVAAAEVLDMVSGTWQMLTDMPTKRNSAFAAAVGGSVVVAGGFSGSVTLATIEVYDTTTDTWQTCAATMTEAFSAGAAASLNGTLYLFGNNQTGLEIGTF